jgi:hypothetical protein
VLSSNSLHQQAQGASHEGLIARPEHAQAVDATRHVVEAVQIEQPLE